MNALIRLQRTLAPLAVLAVLSLATDPQDADEPESPAQRIDPTKESLIRQVIAEAGTTLHAEENIARMIATLAQASPETPDLLWQRLRDNVAPRAIFDIVIALYDRHYSLEEIQGLLYFYRSPAGQEYLGELPKAA
ncbi:MAG TPA: DUF2059 domain-containing protein [Thermoanaerobaculia bacterium]|jgi:hypothetical protein|nr:DUF2059 domain-containing protein [Thermoanaerobaculia bacterium]